MSRPLLSVIGGLALALLFTASPLGLIVMALAPVGAMVAARRLDSRDRQVLFTILGVALAARLAVVIAMFVLAIPELSNLGAGALTGDQAYNLTRSLRTRDILRGFGGLTHYDYFVAADEYGRTSYLGLLTFLQLIFGPAPFGLRLLNSLFFIGGAAILFRALRPRFGLLPASLGLIVVMFLPSLFFASVSVLKESLYFLASSVCLAAAIAAGRTRRPAAVLGLVAVAALSIWILDDLRRGAVALSVAGLACGIAIRALGATRRPLTVAAGAVIAALALVAIVTPLQHRVLAGLTSAAKQHSGHVFTVGHAYKLLDDGFYMNPATPAASTIFLTPGQATRFIARSAATFILTPLPWEARSISERAYLPEHLLWYLLVLMLPFGIAEGWRRDPWATAMIIGFILPTAITLAMTNGNIGTLLRLRGLVTPYLAWISALGFCVVADRVCAAWQGRTPLVGMHKPLGSGG
ncbi:MAG: hypothetical protein ABI024_14190 [Vicinamibacterales bacterium]